MQSILLLAGLLAAPVDPAVRLLGAGPAYRTQIDGGAVVTFDGVGWRRHDSTGRPIHYRSWGRDGRVVAWSPGFELVLTTAGEPARYTLHRGDGPRVDLGRVSPRAHHAACTVMGCAATTSSTEVTVWNARGEIVRSTLLRNRGCPASPPSR